MVLISVPVRKKNREAEYDSRNFTERNGQFTINIRLVQRFVETIRTYGMHHIEAYHETVNKCFMDKAITRP